MGKPHSMRTLRRPRSRWDDIKTDLQEVGRGEWTELNCLRIGTGGGHLKSGNDPSASIKCGECT